MAKKKLRSEGVSFVGFGDVDAVGLEPAADALLIRQSDVASMDLCPARHGYLRSGMAKQVPSEAMSFGTMIHSYIEWRLNGGTDVLTMGRLQDWWVEAVARDGFDLYELAPEETIMSSLQEAIQACSLWDMQVQPFLLYSETLLLEETMQAPLGVLPSGREVWVHGTPDAVDLELGRIDDWKTAARGWKESKAHQTGQASMYGYLVEAVHGVGVADYAYWVWNRKDYRWDKISTSRSRDQIDAYLRHVWQRAVQVDAQAFPFTPWDSTFGEFKRGWWCSAKYCAAWDVCEGKTLADDVWEEEPIDIKAGWERR